MGSSKFKFTSSGQWLHEDEYFEKGISSKPAKPTPNNDLPHSLLDTLNLEISRLTSIAHKFKTCLLKQKAY